MGYSLRSFYRQVRKQEKKKQRYWKKIHRKYRKKKHRSLFQFIKDLLSMRRYKKEYKLSHSVKYAKK